MHAVRRVKVLSLAVLLSVVSVGVEGAGALGTTHPSSSPVAHAVKFKKLAFSASYVGNVKILYGASSVAGTMAGAGTGTTLGRGSVSASGATISFSTSSASDPLSGTALLKGPGGSLLIKSVTVYASTTASAAPTKGAPDPVVISGTVRVVKGTGKFMGATGTLKVTASFSVNTITGSETQKFTAALKGTLSVKA